MQGTEIPAAAEYIVTWWNGERRQHKRYKSEGAAREEAGKLRAHSDNFTSTSMVPIRVMTARVWTRMEELAARGVLDTCKHGLRRLCISCTAETLVAEGWKGGAEQCEDVRSV